MLSKKALPRTRQASSSFQEASTWRSVTAASDKSNSPRLRSTPRGATPRASGRRTLGAKAMRAARAVSGARKPGRVATPALEFSRNHRRGLLRGRLLLFLDFLLG